MSRENCCKLNMVHLVLAFRENRNKTISTASHAKQSKGANNQLVHTFDVHKSVQKLAMIMIKYL